MFAEVAIGELNATQPTKHKALSVFHRMGYSEIFGRTEVSKITGDSVTSAGKLINRLSNVGIITHVLDMVSIFLMKFILWLA